MTTGASARLEARRPTGRSWLRLLAAAFAIAAAHPALAAGGVEGAPDSRPPAAPAPPRSVIFMAGV